MFLCAIYYHISNVLNIREFPHPKYFNFSYASIFLSALILGFPIELNFIESNLHAVDLAALYRFLSALNELIYEV